MAGKRMVLAALGLWLPLFGCDRQPTTSRWDLEIITPHNEDIQREFDAAFDAHMGRDVNIRWVGQSTAQILKTLEASRGAQSRFDLFFGGGIPHHELAAENGLLEAVELSPETLAGIPAQIAGIDNFDDEGYWYGSALSSFGVLVNERARLNQSLPPVTRWETLGSPEYFSWTIVADPRESASVLVAYELILQQYGWADGWPNLMQLFANARQVTSSSSAIPNEVASGNVVAGPCIDFYAFGRLAAAGAGVLQFVYPQGGSAITPDPISMLKNPPHPELARAFMAFVLSPAGQRLWILPPGTEGGPANQALFRLPVREAIYEEHAAVIAAENPYTGTASAFMTLDGELEQRRSPLLKALIGVALVDLHEESRDAWQALNAAGQPAAALALWRELPFDRAQSLAYADQLGDLSREQENRTMLREWRDWFGAKYERVKSLSRQAGAGA
jgi:iron(III) transport system substrate-binding protein